MALLRQQVEEREMVVRCGWLLLLWMVTTVACADELVMKNGDRLTGTIVVKQGNTPMPIS